MEFDYQNYLVSHTVPSEEIEEEVVNSGKTLFLFEEDNNYVIVDVKIGRAQFKTKCYEICYSNGERTFISYIQMLSKNPISPATLFLSTCRNTIQKDLLQVKQRFFDEFAVKGKVKCQETGELSAWEELVVDHRQPNTLSIIVDRFIELNRLEISGVEYFQDERNNVMFKDINLRKNFRKYHKEKATLRIVRKELNSSRTSQARVKAGPKDLKIN